MLKLRSIALGLFLTLASLSVAFAQCGPQAPSLTFCGNTGGSQGLAGYKPLSSIPLPTIAGGTVLGNPTGSSAASVATTAPMLGIPGASQGQIGFAGASGGTATVKAQTTAGSPILLLPNASGTFPSTATSPLTLDGASGALACPTCATTSTTRTKITSAQTYYVSNAASAPCGAFTCSLGSDSNNGMTPAAPFLTPQHAYDVIASSLDMAGKTVSVQYGTSATVYPGVNANQQTVGQAGPQGLQFLGDVSNPSNVIVSTTNADCFTTTTNGTGAISGFLVSGMTLRTTTSGNGLSLWGGGSYIIFGNVNFGTIAGVGVAATHGAFAIQAGGVFSVSGSMTSLAVANNKGTVALHGATLTFSNSPAFSGGFVTASDSGSIYIDFMTYVNGGTVTGPKFQSLTNGVIIGQNSVNDPPGNVQGTVGAGGQYVIGAAAYSIPGRTDVITTSTTLSEYQTTVLVDATSAPVTVTLPAESNSTTGTTFSVIKVDSTANAVTVVGTGVSLFISGLGLTANYVISKSYAGIEAKSDNNNWVVTWNTSDWGGNAVPVTGGGTGAATFTAHGVLLGEGTSPFGVASIGTAGRLFVDKGASSDPAFVASGGDCTTAVSTTINFTCTKTNGTSFGTLATITPGTGVATALGVNVGTAGAVVVNGGALGTPSAGVLTNATGLPLASVVGAGTAAAANTGTSGATVPLLNGVNTFSAAQTFSVGILTSPVTISALPGGGTPACNSGLKGYRSFVTDNNTALAFAAVITTGGTIQTPVYCDGTIWRQG